MYSAKRSTAALRTAWLDGISDAALESLQAGSSVVSVSSAGTTTQFQFLASWSPASVIELVDDARAWVLSDTSTVTDALAMIADTDGAYGFNFSGASGFR